MAQPVMAAPRLIVFDCDGVLVDSEPASARLLAELAASYGRKLDAAALDAFRGRRWSDLQPDFAAVCGQHFGADWPALMQQRLLAQMARDGLPTMPGARETLLAIRALGLPYRVASNSSLSEMAEKFRLCALSDLTDGLCHSSGTSGRGKPAPDVYLEAAAASGIAPAHAIAIEDSVPGARAALSAGMRCLGYAPNRAHAAELAALGAEPVAGLAEALAVIRAALQGALVS